MLLRLNSTGRVSSGLAPHFEPSVTVQFGSSEFQLLLSNPKIELLTGKEAGTFLGPGSVIKHNTNLKCSFGTICPRHLAILISINPAIMEKAQVSFNPIIGIQKTPIALDIYLSTFRVLDLNELLYFLEIQTLE